MKAAIYLRASQPDEIAGHLAALREFAKSRGDEVEEYIDRTTAPASAFDRVLRDGVTKRIGIVLVRALSQLASDVPGLVRVLVRLRSSGLHVASLDQPVDTSTPTAQPVLDFISALAASATAFRQERTQLRLALQRASGCRIGRPPKLVDHQRVIQTYQATRSLRRTARLVGGGVSRSLVNRIVRAHGNGKES